MDGPVPREEPSDHRVLRHRVLRHRDRVAGPWANGGGITYEVMRCPEDDPDFDWRLSIAEVAREGPFSPYPGIDRILVVLRGEMRLVIDGTPHDALPFTPVAFPGEARVDSLLSAGPTMDFNVMTRRGRATASVDIVEGPDIARTPPPHGWVAALVLDGEWSTDGQAEPLGSWDCVITGSPLRLSGHGRVACVALGGAGQRSDPRSDPGTESEQR